jgi:cytochrome c oxidase assembly protein subunit 15
LRHLPAAASPAEFQSLVVFHLVLAAAVTGHVSLLAWRARRADRQVGALRPAVVAAVLVAVQLLLGAGTWVGNYGWPAWLADTTYTAGNVVQARGLGQSLITTAHVANGSLIVAAAVVAALRTARAAWWHRRPVAAETPRPLEAAA